MRARWANVLLSGLLAHLAAACVGAPADPEIIKARETRQQYFADNLDSYQPRSDDEKRIVNKLKEYKDAHERFDARALDTLLSRAFELEYYFHSNEILKQDKHITVQVQTRQEYLEKRRFWVAQDRPGRRLDVSIKAMRLNAGKNSLAVVGAITEVSKYFGPRFLHTFVFSRAFSEQDWTLERLMVYRMLPPRPELYEVAIFLGSPLPIDRPLVEIFAEGPDVLFDKYFALAKSASAASRHVPLLIVFREPPPEQSVIVVREEQLGGRVYESVDVVRQNGSPYYWMRGVGWYGRGYSVKVDVSMYDQKGDRVPIATEFILLQ